MKKTVSKLVLPVLLLVGLTSTAQRRTNATPETGESVYLQAKSLNQKMETISLNFEKVRYENARQRKMAELIKKGTAISKNAEKAGKTMSDAKAADFEKQMDDVVRQMDKLTSTPLFSGQTSGECFGSCDSQYSGWGHGKGWNRFWCKASCFKINVHVG